MEDQDRVVVAHRGTLERRAARGARRSRRCIARRGLQLLGEPGLRRVALRARGGGDRPSRGGVKRTPAAIRKPTSTRGCSLLTIGMKFQGR